MTFQKLRFDLLGLCALGLLFSLGCDPAETDPGGDPAPGETLRGDQALVRSDLPRAVPNLAPAELAAQVEGNTAFGLELYQQLREEEDGNLFLSPLSISVALGMTHAGALGNTAQEMSGALHYVLSGDKHHEAFNAIDQALASRGEGAEGSDGGAFRLKINNAIWGQDGYPIEAPFLDVLARHYDAGLRQLDFVAQPETSREIINEWVSFHTEEKIPELIPEGMITALTRLVLTNTVYFNAAWKYPLDESTREAPFTRLDGQVVQAETMHRIAGFGYVERDGFEAIELPYDGDELSMVVLLPAAGEFQAFEASLSPAMLDEALGALQTLEVDLGLPKFTFSKQLMLRGYLEALGMIDAFIPDVADLTGITAQDRLYISGIIHEAFVDVHEMGTEAAAATGVVVGTTSVPYVDVEVRVDRPFLFLIRDIETGTVLFLGRVLDPTE